MGLWLGYLMVAWMGGFLIHIRMGRKENKRLGREGKSSFVVHVRSSLGGHVLCVDTWVFGVS